MMRIGDNNVPYNDAFRFYITTKLPNPHYAPETCVKVTILNFAITPRGLQEQLLGVAIAEELPEIQEQKELLVVNNAKMNKQLDDIEDRILYLLENCKGNILDDVEIIETLDQAKITSNDIAEKMKEAAITEKEIDEQRANYKPLADHATTLFFTLTKIEEEGNGDLRVEKSNLRQMVQRIILVSLTTNRVLIKLLYMLLYVICLRVCPN